MKAENIEKMEEKKYKTFFEIEREGNRVITLNHCKILLVPLSLPFFPLLSFIDLYL